MKHIFLLIQAVFFSHFVFAQKDEQLLRQLEYEWLRAEFRNDTATIARMMDEAFIAIGTTGVSSKQEELEGIYKNMSQRIKDGHVVDSLYFEDIVTRFYGSTAIITFISVTKGKIKDVSFNNRRTRIYDVWIRKEGKWKAVTSQVTPIR